jgi:hypothetical protein
MRSKSAYGHFHVLPLFLTNNKMPFSLNCCILNTYSILDAGVGAGEGGRAQLRRWICLSPLLDPFLSVFLPSSFDCFDALFHKFLG